MIPGRIKALSFLLNSLAELAPVKNHFFRASREVLLGLQQLLEIADTHVATLQTGPSLADQKKMMVALIALAQKTIGEIVRQIPQHNDDEYRVLHRKVMHSILEVIEIEITKNTRKKSEKTQMKVEVLSSIRQVLLKEMYEQETKDGEKYDLTG